MLDVETSFDEHIGFALINALDSFNKQHGKGQAGGKNDELIPIICVLSLSLSAL